jgi:hypothetical protein
MHKVTIFQLLTLPSILLFSPAIGWNLSSLIAYNVKLVAYAIRSLPNVLREKRPPLLNNDFFYIYIIYYLIIRVGHLMFIESCFSSFG